MILAMALVSTIPMVMSSFYQMATAMAMGGAIVMAIQSFYQMALALAMTMAMAMGGVEARDQQFLNCCCCTSLQPPTIKFPQ